MMDVPYVGNESPPLRSTVLGFGASFLRGRPRATSHVDNSASVASPGPNNNSQLPESNAEPFHARSPSATGHRRRPGTGGNSNNNNNTGASTAQPAVSHTPSPSEAAAAATTPSLGLSMLRRRRSGNGGASLNANANTNAVPPSPAVPMNRATTNPVLSNGTAGASHRIRLVPHLDSRRTLRFEPICRNLKEGDAALRIGRFTDRSGMGLAASNALSSNKLAFKSKVVSRAHAEVWVDAGGKFFIKDTKSSSGTFLNHVRLSPANSESKPHQIKDGDILQLGVDYQGGTEDIYKSVKIRIEVGREWQAAANAFKYVSALYLLRVAIYGCSRSTNALSQLKSLAVSLSATTPAPKKSSLKTTIPDCCICMPSVSFNNNHCTYNPSAPHRPIRSNDPPSPLHRALFSCIPL
jgi:E3 ubiquitin-protein ligase DMA1/2